MCNILQQFTTFIKELVITALPLLEQVLAFKQVDWMTLAGARVPRVHLILVHPNLYFTPLLAQVLVSRLARWMTCDVMKITDTSAILMFRPMLKAMGAKTRAGIRFLKLRSWAYPILSKNNSLTTTLKLIKTKTL